MTLRLGIEVPDGPLRRSEGATITVTLTNAGSQPVTVNRRLAPGYSDSVAREIFFAVDAPFGKVKYERAYPTPGDFVALAPGAQVSNRFDLLAWYRFPVPGTYTLTAHYQADEPGAGAPTGTTSDVIASAPFTIDVA